MQNNKNAFSALQNIELWCNSIKNANTVTAKCAGMLALLMEVEYAIEKYRSMAERFKTQLPTDVTVKDFEEWAEKLDEIRSMYILKDIKDYNNNYFKNRKDDDHDIEEAFSMAETDKMDTGQSVPMSFIDEQLAENIANLKNFVPYLEPAERVQVDNNTIRIADARTKVLELEIGSILTTKFRWLTTIIEDIIELLTTPTKEAFHEIYVHFCCIFYENRGLKHCDRQEEEWIEDHEDKTNFLELLDEKITNLRKEINENFYGETWDDFFKMYDNLMIIETVKTGRYIYRNLDLFKNKPDYLNQFLIHLFHWIGFNNIKNERNGRLKRPNTEDENKQEVVNDILLPEIFKDSLRNNPARTELLLNIIRKDIIPRVTERKGAKDKKWRWPHVYYAFKDPRLDFIAADTAKIAFGRAMHDIENSLVANNIAQTFKDLNPKFPLVPDQAIITDMVNLFKAV
ncbi:MAG: hypothetical protein MJZ83_09615 [Bacteroidaceae bacterium]|nr:hypothetical protein [Bacteroidaceae bacterium]